jgi:SAM-dependent methyltransferase
MPTKPDVVVQYVLDGSDEDLKRLLRISALLSATTRAALATVDIRPGWRALECGCGPLGAMAILSDLVGESGHVVGIDFTPSTVQRARSVVHELGLRNVEVRVADINDPAADVGGPYDVAFTRCFLMHQGDPLHTLTRIRAALRPGGWLVAMEPLPSPAPFSFPPDDDLRVAWELLHQAVHRGGASPTAVNDLPATAKLAGFDVVHIGGSFQPTDAATGYGLHAATTAAVRERIIATGVATADEVDAVIARLQTAAASGGDGWVSSPLSLVVTLRNPGGDDDNGTGVA